MGILDRFDLSGKTALVTGCRRGIGRAFAQGLAEAGADIVGVSASLASGSEVEGDVTELGRSFRPYACDFSDRDALRAFIAQVKADVAQVDILVNNAGTILREPAADHPDEYWDRVIEVKFECAICARARIWQRDGGTRIWQSCFYSVSAEFSGWNYRAGLRRCKRGYCDFDDGAVK